MSNNSMGQLNGGHLVCIKRPESGLSAVFEEMYLSERLVDVTLSCNNGQIQAHKLVLAACSPYFSGVFDKLANPFQYPVIVIKDMQIEDLKLMVDFMYRGNLTISQDRLESLIKCAESLQITGLSNLDNTTWLATAATDHINGETTAIINVEAPRLAPNHHQKSSSSSKRAKRMHSSNQLVFERTYHHMRVHHHHNSRNDNLSPDKLLEQSLITGEAQNIDGQHFDGYNSNNHPTSAKNLANNSNHHHHGLNTSSSSSSSLQVQHAMNMNPQHQLQVLSHSLTSNRTSGTNAQTAPNNSQINMINDGNNNSDQTSSSSRGRLHPCHICWKTFRERANLKRHLQIHSQDRVMYACIECNKTFSWKDNYIRHTKTTHHMNNARQQA